MHNKVREWIFKMRGGLWTLLFIAILFMVRKSEPRIIFAAIIIILAGQLWRCWAAGSIGLYRGEKVKAVKLATKGPYALMRNPLYFGNFLIGLGWSLIAGYGAVLIFLISFFILYVKIIIPYEEKFLSQKFGSEYLNWKSKTGMFWPNSKPENLKILKGDFDLKVLFKSEIHTLITTLAGTCLILLKTLCYT